MYYFAIFCYKINVVVSMAIKIDFKKQKNKSSYKTIYLKDDVIDKLNDLSYKHNTSFNNIVTKMIEYCLKEGF